MLRNWALRYGSFNPKTALWPLGTEAGMWLDQSDAATGYQDRTSVAAIIDSPIGVRLDKRLGLSTTELITVAADRDFSSDTGFWTKDVGITIGGGVASFNANTNFALYKNSWLTVGKVYDFTFTVTSYTSGGIAPTAGGLNGTAATAVGTYTQRLTCSAAQLYSGFITTAASTIASIDNVSVKEVLGNHVSQATSPARPLWKLNGAIYSDLFDGVDDTYATASFAAGALTTGMTCFAAIKRNAATKGVFAWVTNASAPFFGAWDSTDSVARPDSGAGTPTYLVNGTGVTANRAALNTAMPNGSWVVLEIQGLDLSLWTILNFFNYSAFTISADLGGVIICPTPSAAVLNQTRTYLGAKVGLTL